MEFGGGTGKKSVGLLCDKEKIAVFCCCPVIVSSKTSEKFIS